MLQIGQQAPEFKLNGVLRGRVGEHSLESLKGNWLVLFFYPADFSFICPTEVVGFSKAAQSQFRSGAQFFAIAVGAAVLGYLIGLIVQYFFPGIEIPA